MKPTITFSTCWYSFKSKFPSTVYMKWIDNMLSSVNQYYLVVYCDTEGYKNLEKYECARIKLIIRPVEAFYLYRFKEFWITNHAKNVLLNERIGWEVNMLWNEKIWFVENTIRENYFGVLTDFYGWCDIGYFREEKVVKWPSPEKLALLNKDTVHYACVNNDDKYLEELIKGIREKKIIPKTQVSIAGGFFILTAKKIDWWRTIYENQLISFIRAGYLIKDDQIILATCIFSNPNLTKKHFSLYREKNPLYDNWFMFQRLLFYEKRVVTILMPIYNGVEFFTESLNSVVSQTYTSWELIIGINGYRACSHVYKKVLSIIAKISTKELKEKIKVLDFPDVNGKGATLNAMKKYCIPETEYIAILDVDDVWNPHKLAVQSKYIGNYDVIGTKCVYFGEIRNISPDIPTGNISTFNFFKMNPIINSSALIRKEFAVWSDRFGLDDYELWIQLRKAGKTFFNCDEIMVKHRIHKNSAFNSKGNHGRVKELLDFYKC